MEFDFSSFINDLEAATKGFNTAKTVAERYAFICAMRALFEQQLKAMDMHEPQFREAMIKNIMQRPINLG